MSYFLQRLSFWCSTTDPESSPAHSSVFSYYSNTDRGRGRDHQRWQSAEVCLSGWLVDGTDRAGAKRAGPGWAAAPHNADLYSTLVHGYRYTHSMYPYDHVAAGLSLTTHWAKAREYSRRMHSNRAEVLFHTPPDYWLINYYAERLKRPSTNTIYHGPSEPVCALLCDGQGTFLSHNIS